MPGARRAPHHHVVRPQRRDVIHLLCQLAAAPDAVLGDVPAHVSTRCHALWLRVSGVENLHQRARFRVPEAKHEKVEGDVARKGHKVALRCGTVGMRAGVKPVQFGSPHTLRAASRSARAPARTRPPAPTSARGRRRCGCPPCACGACGAVSRQHPAAAAARVPAGAEVGRAHLRLAGTLRSRARIRTGCEDGRTMCRPPCGGAQSWAPHESLRASPGACSAARRDAISLPRGPGFYILFSKNKTVPSIYGTVSNHALFHDLSPWFS